MKVNQAQYVPGLDLLRFFAACIVMVFHLAFWSWAFPAGQIALAWLLHKGDGIVPIPGTKRRTYLEENVGAGGISLSPEGMGALDAALAPENVSGPRYAEKHMAQVDR